jgi:hypothetical protein
MNIKKIEFNPKDLEKENFENVTQAFYDLPERGSDEYAKRSDELRASLYFSLGFIELYTVMAAGLDINGDEIQMIYDVIS